MEWVMVTGNKSFTLFSGREVGWGWYIQCTINGTGRFDTKGVIRRQNHRPKKRIRILRPSYRNKHLFRHGKSVDRAALARVRGCSDASCLSGAACTRKCEFRRNCRITRTPFLIQAENVKVELLSKDLYSIQDNDKILYICVDEILERIEEEYINQIFEME